MLPIATKINDVDMVRLRDHVISAPLITGKAGDYPWDRWEAAAVKAGVNQTLVNLGRSVFREASQHQWSESLQVECGWLDGGQRMIYQALGFPHESELRWSHLMDTDGQPYEVDPVETDEMALAIALKNAGIPISVIL